MVSSTNQSFSGQHHLQKPQQQQGHSNQQYPQPQSQNHNQAYVHVVRQLHQQHHQQRQQQQNRYLQSQQQFPASSSQLSPLLTQSHPTGFFFAVKEVFSCRARSWCKQCISQPEQAVRIFDKYSNVHFIVFHGGIWCYIDIVLPGIGASSGIQTMSAGLTLLQGTNSVQLGSGLVASSVGLNVGATARDVQRFASGRSLSVSIDEQQQRLQHYNRLVAGRSLQPSAVTVSAGFSIIGLPNSNDCAVPTAGNGTGMMCGLGRGMALPRPGFLGLGSAGIPGMVSSGISNMLSSNGLGLPVSGPAPSRTMHVLGSMIRRPRDVQMLQTSQEQRQMLMQELPLQASQNNSQTASSFNGVNTAYSNQMVSSTNQSFSGQHHLQKPQQKQGHSNQQYPQPQSQNHNQAYVHVVCQLHQQRHQQHQQQQNRARGLQQAQAPELQRCRCLPPGFLLDQQGQL